MEPILNHLWQSTAFAVVVSAICLVLRRNRARVRYWLWLIASLKLLVPFSLLVSLGNRIEWQAGNPPVTAMAVERISTTFSPAPTLDVSGQTADRGSRWPLILASVWAIGFVIVITRWIRRWRWLSAVKRTAEPAPLEFPAPVLVTRSPIEPGVFGILRPVLMLPEGLPSKLTPQQLQAILAHELCHLRERDNLTAAVHMFVQAVFWFHPVVWWIGARLIEERERACDESVVAQGGWNEDYAAGILSVCKYYLESPLACAAGVTGSDLKRRIREIMTRRVSCHLTFARKTFLALTATLVCSAPLIIGLLRAQTLPPPPAYGYEVATIRAAKTDDPNSRIGPGPQGGLRAQNVTIMALLRTAYNLQSFQFASVPGWVTSDRYDLTFTPDRQEITPGPNLARAEFEGLMERQRQRLQAVLRDRLGLVLKTEKRDLPLFSLVVAKGGHKLSASSSSFPHLRSSRRAINGKGVYLSRLAAQLAQMFERHVENDTGLDGPFDFTVEWTASDPSNEANEVDRSALVTALTEQLGLKLEPKRGPVPVFVIEKIEKPSEN